MIWDDVKVREGMSNGNEGLEQKSVGLIVFLTSETETEFIPEPRSATMSFSAYRVTWSRLQESQTPSVCRFSLWSYLSVLRTYERLEQRLR